MMDSPLTGSSELLVIRTENLDFSIAPKRTVSKAYSQAEQSSSLRIAAKDIEEICMPAQGKKETYSDHQGMAFHEFQTAPQFFEQTDYLINVRSRNGEKLEFLSNNRAIGNCVNPIMGDSSILSGVINYGNNVGFSDFVITADGKTVLTIQVEVYPSKITYKEDYQAMMADIDQLVSECVLDFLKKTYQVFVPDHKRNETPAVFFTILQTLYDKYLQALHRILDVPHHKLITEHEVLPFNKVRRTDALSEKWLRKHPEHVKRDGGRILADRALSARKTTTYDTQENRMVKFMLRSTIRRIEDFSNRYQRSTKSPDPDIMKTVQKAERELRRMLSSSFLAEVSELSAMKSMSLVFGMAPGYRELYKYYLMLQNGLAVGGEIFRMSTRETALLYEYWCFLKLYSILKEHYELQSPDIIKVTRKGVTVDLAQGKPSRIAFLNTKTGEHLYLAYNPSETVTQTVNQRPDNVLELEKKGSKHAYKYVFDAKYRIEMNPDGAFYPDMKPGPKVDDINTMHRYRDAIVYENSDSRFTFEKTMFGAYILFPYGNEEEYKNHRFYRSIESVNIGGLPFLPSATKLVEQFLDTLISDSSESAFERASLPVGIEDRIRTVDWDKRDVLIGLVPDEDHLNTFLHNRMYFTRRFDKENLPIHYLALYEKEKGIAYYGEVISWQEKKRNQLPGRSRHANEDYHVFRVKEWKKLPSMIVTEETGPNPIAYTNYFLLSTAKSYSELRLRSAAEYRFFIELRRRVDAKINNGAGQSVGFEFDDVTVSLDEDRIMVVRDGKIIGVEEIQEFQKKPNAIFRRLMGKVR